MRRVWLSSIVAGCLAVALALPASAKPLVHQHYSASASGSAFVCGELLNWEWSSSGLFMLKEGKRGDPTPYWFDNNKFQTVWTDPADPTRGFIESGNGLWRDQHITNIGGTVYHFEVHQVGTRYQLSTLEGKKVLKDRGRITWVFDVDTLGDNNPANDIWLTPAVAESVAGPHPLLNISSADWCTAVLGILNA